VAVLISSTLNDLSIASSKYINKINKKLEELNKEAMKSMRRRIGDKKLGDNETPKFVEPTTKVCPYCLSEIPHKAIKCSHCASELKVEKEEAVVRDGGEVNE